MTHVRGLLAAALVCAFAATAPAQPPDAASTTPPTPRAASEPGATAETTTDDAAPAAVVVVSDHPLKKYVLPGAAFLAVLVIALFVIRWRKTGEIPGPSSGPPTAP
jgi:hypothetical protein